MTEATPDRPHLEHLTGKVTEPDTDVSHLENQTTGETNVNETDQRTCDEHLQPDSHTTDETTVSKMTTSHVYTTNSSQPPKTIPKHMIPSDYLLPANDTVIGDMYTPDTDQQISFEHANLLEACNAQSYSSTSTSSSSCSTDSSSMSDGEDYNGPEFILDTGATNSYATTHTPIRQPRQCHRHVRGVSGKPILVYKEGRCAAIPLVGISKNFRRNLASVSQLARSNNTVFIFDAKQAFAYQGPTQLPPSAARIGTATDQGLYTLDMQSYRQLLRSSTSTAHLAGEATEPYGISQVRSHFQNMILTNPDRSHDALVTTTTPDNPSDHPSDQISLVPEQHEHSAFPVADYHPSENSMLLHTRMGHASKRVMIQALKQGITLGVNITLDELIHSNLYCKACATSHITRKPFPRKSVREPHKTILGLIHTDTAGPRPTSITYQNRLNHKSGEYKYWQVYVDDHSKFIWINFLRKKDELPSRMKAMQRHMELDAKDSYQNPPPGQLPLTVQAYRSDNAGELTSKQAVRSLLKAMIDHERTVPGSSQQNSYAESAIKVIQDMARTLLDSAKFPLRYWPFAISTAVYLVNRLPSTTNDEGKSRYEMFYGNSPDFSTLKTFGAVVTKFLPIPKRRHGDKQSPSGEGGNRHRLVGYPRKTKGYLVLDTQKEPHPKVFACRHIHLQEDTEEYPSMSDDSTEDDTTESDSVSLPNSSSSSSSTNLSGYSADDSDSQRSSSPSDSQDPTSSSDPSSSSEQETQSEHDDSNTDDPDLNAHRTMVKSRARDTVNKLARRHRVDAQLLCRLNDNIPRHDGRPRQLRPSDHLKRGTELFLPTPSDEERFNDSSSSEVDNSSSSSRSDQDAPAPSSAECKEPPSRSPLPAANLLECAPREQQLESNGHNLPSELSIHLEEEALYTDMASTYAATPVVEACADTTKALSVCHELIRSAFHSTVESFREQRHTKTYIDFNLNKLKDEAYHIFLCSFDKEQAHLVDALRHVKGRDIPNPKNYAEAMQSEFQEFWNAAIAEEIANLKAYDVFRFEILPPGVKPINCRYVFKVKINQQGLVDRFKARLVVQGFRQRFGVDYLKTHASVCKMQTFRYQMAHAAQHDLKHEIIDVKSAYLEAKMKLPVYINIPGHPAPPGMAARLLKSLYGTKQAGRNWHQTIVPLLTSKWNFTQSAADPCMFFHYTSKDDYCVLCLFVDDFSITSTRTHTKSRDTFMKLIQEKFHTSKSDDDNVYLGIRCRRLGPHKIFLDQSLYIEDFLHMYGFKNVRPVATPTSGLPLSKTQCPVEQSEKDAMSKHPYRQIIGSLRYLEQCTRPDISFALNRLSRYQVNPGLPHWNELKHLVRYVASTIKHGILFGKNGYPMHATLQHDLSGPLECFVDSDHAADKDTRRSCTSYVFFSRGGPISWRSRLQSSTAMSTCEAEFMAASDAACENAWLRRLIGEFTDLNTTRINGLLVPQDIAAPRLSSQFFDNEVPTRFNEDNIGCIQSSEDPVLHGRMKHVDIRYHRLKEFVSLGQCKLLYVPTSRQIGDMGTKVLPKKTFCTLRDCVVIDPFANTK